MAHLIGRVIISPAVAQPAQTIRVEVLGHADAARNVPIANVVINGTPGAIQYLQFPSEGRRRLLIVATGVDGKTEQTEEFVEIAGKPLEFTTLKGQKDIAMIGVTQSLTHPYEAVLTLGSMLDTRSVPSVGLASPVAPSRSFVIEKSALRVSRAKAGPLDSLFLAKGKGQIKVESRRVTRLCPAHCQPKPKGKSSPTPLRVAVTRVFDLGTLDVGKYLAESGKTTPPTYQWDFGDGTTSTTRTPAVRHDYFAAIDHASGIGQFVVTCKVMPSGVTAQRTLTVQSAYTLCKRLGTVVPHVVADTFARKRQNRISASFVVHNVENTPMTLNRLSVTPLTDDPNALSLPRPFVTLDVPIVIKANSRSLISVNVPAVPGSARADELPFDTRGFTALYAGSVGNTPVRCSAVFDIPLSQWGTKPPPAVTSVPDAPLQPWTWENVVTSIGVMVDHSSTLSRDSVRIDPTTATLAIDLGALSAGRAAAQGEARNVVEAMYVPSELARMRKQEPLVRRDKSTVGLKRQKFVPQPLFGGWGESMQALNGPPMPGMVAEGEVCDPDNIDDLELALAEEQQLVCQLTSEVMEVTMPGRWMNGRKGDILLSPGGEGIIGGLMLNVSPPQWYSHSGIMTRNYDEITHSTGSQRRLMDHLRGISDGSDGFEPAILKYIWPGAITQSVELSIRGEDFPDPEFNKTYSMSAFGPHTIGVTHNDQMKMIPPLVLKPDPMQETPAIRSSLHAIANDAKTNAGRPGRIGKYHYRWYCYTDPQIGLGAPEGPEAGWAAGTRASVCSSYIWMHAKGRSARLETDQALVTPTDLEPADVATGAAVRPVTPDGLYRYSAAERRAAGEWLYNRIYNEAYEKAGWLGNILTDAADDIANQFLNAFANDDADGKDSEEWRTVYDADAVSPDDMLWWDGPDRGGLYGYAEPAKYREPRIETYTVSRWKQVLSRGNVRGRVFDAGAPAPGAMVQVYEGKTDFSNADGTYLLPDVPLGPYKLKASKVVNGVLKAAQTDITLSTADLVVDLHLQDPPDRYRKAQVFIDFWGRDEEWAASDEIHDPGPEYFELELGPDRLTNVATRTYKWGGEVRVEYVMTFRLLVNNAIDIDIQGKLYEGTGEDTNDLDGTGSTTFIVDPGQTRGATLSITNTAEEDSDEGQLSISVKNVRNDA